MPNQLPLELLRGLSARAPRGALRGQLVRSWRQAIDDGRLPAGMALPGTRRLADALGIGRSTLVEVVEQLALEGYLATRPGAATRVASLARPPAQRSEASEQPPARSSRWRLDDPPTPVGLRAFRPGLPDLARLSASGWAQHLARRARQPGGHDLSYAHGTGVPALQRALIDHLRQTRGVRAEPDQVLIVPSAQAAFDILARATIRPGATAWVEDPGYPGIRSVLRGAGARVVGRPVDANGMVLGPRGRSAWPRLIHVTPSHQYPTGVTMTLQRRLELLALARDHRALVVEDDYDSEYQFRGDPIASLQGLDRDGCVAYVGTFSKTMAPGVRAAYLVVPARHLDLARTICTITGHAVSVPLQWALADFLAEGGLRRHVRKASAEAGRRLTRLAELLRAAGERRLQVPAPSGGLQMCVGWSGRTSDVDLVGALGAAGVAAVALSTLCHGRPRSGLLLGVGLVEPDEIAPAVERMQAVIARTA